MQMRQLLNDLVNAFSLKSDSLAVNTIDLIIAEQGTDFFKFYENITISFMTPAKKIFTGHLLYAA